MQDEQVNPAYDEGIKDILDLLEARDLIYERRGTLSSTSRGVNVCRDESSSWRRRIRRQPKRRRRIAVISVRLSEAGMSLVHIDGYGLDTSDLLLELATEINALDGFGDTVVRIKSEHPLYTIHPDLYA